MRALLRDPAYVPLIPVAATPSVRMTLVHLETSVISPFRVEAWAIIIVVAPVVALPVRRAADANAKTRSFKVNSLCHGRRVAPIPAIVPRTPAAISFIVCSMFS